uniref:Uncharacterized protein n=1 Tax=Anguilla anguilla TaxID=7936 RepID=A0A0E9T1U7_ANGAN
MNIFSPASCCLLAVKYLLPTVSLVPYPTFRVNERRLR